MCNHDGSFDYRDAWESDPRSGEKARKKVDQIKKKADARRKNDSILATIVHDDVQTKIVSGKTIFDYADQLSVQVPTSCYRTGHCHECVVEIRRGMEALEPLTEKESFLNDNYRLACQAKIIRDDVDVEFSPLRRTPKILTVGVEKSIDLEPMVIHHSGDVFYDGERVDDPDRGYAAGGALGTGDYAGGDLGGF